MKTLRVSYWRRTPATTLPLPEQHLAWSYSEHRAPTRALDLWLLRQPFSMSDKLQFVDNSLYLSSKCDKLKFVGLGQRVISQIQQPSRARDDVSILDLEIDATDIDTALADLEDDRVFACGIFLEHGLFHERVRVAAGAEVDAAYLRRDLRIADFVVSRIRVIAKMRHAHDQLTLLLFAQQTHDAARHLHRVHVLHALKILRRDQVVGIDSQSEESDAHTAKRSHCISLDARFQNSAAHVVVRRNEIKVRELHRGCERVHPVVEIVIAEGDHVITNQRHRFVFDLALVEVEVRRALKNVARVSHQRVRIFFANAFDECGATCDTALAGPLLVAFADGIDL